MPDVIFHIGMGKTGTSSIQGSLAKNREALLTQGVAYIGMWFDIIDARFAGPRGHETFFDSSKEEVVDYAGLFYRNLSQVAVGNGARRFIISNEGFYGRFYKMAEFIDELSKYCNVRIIAYARDPREWLPSAYSQWSIRHKNYTGGMQSFSEMSRTLIGVYRALLLWKDRFQGIMEVRKFEKNMDVVTDFAKALAIDIPRAAERSLERLSAGEALLRVFYNSRLHGNTLPDAFDHAFHGVDLSSATGVEQIINDALDYSDVEAIVSDHYDMFEEIKKQIGIDLLAGASPVQKPVSIEETRHRALDHALLILMHQADKLSRLEAAVTALQNELKKK